jgi:hypothetical protein
MTIEQLLQQANELTADEQLELATRLLLRVRTQPNQQPSTDLYGMLADLGAAPSAEDIDAARAEMWANFPREDI